MPTPCARALREARTACMLQAVRCRTRCDDAAEWASLNAWWCPLRTFCNLPCQFAVGEAIGMLLFDTCPNTNPFLGANPLRRPGLMILTLFCPKTMAISWNLDPKNGDVSIYKNTFGGGALPHGPQQHCYAAATRTLLHLHYYSTLKKIQYSTRTVPSRPAAVPNCRERSGADLQLERRHRPRAEYSNWEGVGRAVGRCGGNHFEPQPPFHRWKNFGAGQTQYFRLMSFPGAACADFLFA